MDLVDGSMKLWCGCGNAKGAEQGGSSEEFNPPSRPVIFEASAADILSTLATTDGEDLEARKIAFIE